jgi:hypothetical protein
LLSIVPIPGTVAILDWRNYAGTSLDCSDWMQRGERAGQFPRLRELREKCFAIDRNSTIIASSGSVEQSGHCYFCRALDTPRPQHHSL